MNAEAERRTQEANGRIATLEPVEGELIEVHDDSQERAMLDIQIVTAKRYPRSVKQFKEAALGMACLDEETAASCFFTLPRGKAPIQGPSIRLAEICATAWGHIHAQVVIEDIGSTHITARAVAWDMQNNVRIGQEVKRRITDRQGRRYNEDMIGVTCNAATSIALRNAIFRVIPRAYVDAIYKEARRVAVGDAKTLAARRISMVQYFAKLGISEDRLLMAVDAPSVEDITLDMLASLKGMATAIKDGDTSIEDCFPEAEKKDRRKKPAPAEDKNDDPLMGTKKSQVATTSGSPPAGSTEIFNALQERIASFDGQNDDEGAAIAAAIEAHIEELGAKRADELIEMLRTKSVGSE